MAFVLTREQSGHGLGPSLEAILSEQLNIAQRYLSTPLADEWPEAVHGARKACKRARAVVRLLHFSIGRQTARDLAQQIGSVARTLSTVRDRQMLLARLLEQQETTHVLAEHRALEQLRQAWTGLPVVDGSKELRERLLRDLADLGMRVRALNLWTGSRPIATGLRRIMSRFRRAFRVAANDLSTEKTHLLRKRSKDLFYALTLMKRILPSKFQRWCRRLKRLNDALGFEHDLFLQMERLREVHVLSETDSSMLEKKWSAQRGKLQKTALRLAQSLATKSSRWFERVVREAFRRKEEK